MPGTGIVAIGVSEWSVNVATTDIELTTGLGGLESIPVGSGMLFILPATMPIEVTTEPMLFNIDIIFIDEDLHVIGVMEDVPPGYIVTQDNPVKYFLEVNAGESILVEIGDGVDLSGVSVPEEPSGYSGIISQITPIVMIGFVSAMMSGMMSGMNPKDASKRKKYLPKGAKYTKTGMMVTKQKKNYIEADGFVCETGGGHSDCPECKTYCPEYNEDYVTEDGKLRRRTIWHCPKCGDVVRDKRYPVMDNADKEYTESCVAKASRAGHVKHKAGRAVPRRSGVPRSESERKKEHESRFNEKELPPRGSGHYSNRDKFYRCRAVFEGSGEIWESKVFADEGRAKRYLEKTFLPMADEHTAEHGAGSADVSVIPATSRFDEKDNPGPKEGNTVECPICGEILEVPMWDSVTRSDVLSEHLSKKHSVKKVS